jgi:hypothetical protein
MGIVPAPEQPSGVVGASLTAESTAAEKITLFRRLFAGRQDVGTLNSLPVPEIEPWMEKGPIHNIFVTLIE